MMEVTRAVEKWAELELVEAPLLWLEVARKWE
jgi:hypothetical protein